MHRGRCRRRYRSRRLAPALVLAAVVTAIVADRPAAAAPLSTGPAPAPAPGFAGPAPLPAPGHATAGEPSLGPRAVASASPLAGRWRGALALPGGQALTIVLHIVEDDGGGLRGSMDSPDQGAIGIPVDRVVVTGDTVEVVVSSIGGRYLGRLEAADRMTGTWHQGGLSMPLDFERVEGDAALGPPRPQVPQPPFPYHVEEITYPNAAAGIELAGTLTLPPGAGPYPAVALITGSGAQDRDQTVAGHKPFLVLADFLTRRGTAVLRSDDRGVAGSGGDFATATSRDFAGDAAAAVAYLRGRSEVDQAAVGLVGHSEGGIIAAMIAAERDDVDFIVLLGAPGLPGEEILYVQGDLIGEALGVPEPLRRRNTELQRRIFAAVRETEDPARRRQDVEAVLRAFLDATPPNEVAAMGIPPGAEEGWIAGQVAAVTSPWFRFFLLHDPREDLRRIRVPVLAVTGELDLQVPPGPNLTAIRQALEEAGNTRFAVHELPRLNHLFQTAVTGAPAEYSAIEETFAPEALEVIARWVLEVTGAAR